MLTVGLIGYGAIAQHVATALPNHNAQLSLVIARQGREDVARRVFGNDVAVSNSLGDARPDIVVDCAGHAGLREYGSAILTAGVPVITVSIGALAETAFHDELEAAARLDRVACRKGVGS